MSALDQVDTIVLLMLENRSFDHMLGHLGLPKYANGSAAEGLTLPLNQFANLNKGQQFPPFEMKDRVLQSDLPHDRGHVTTQLAKSAVTGRFEMKGFVKAYFDYAPASAGTLKPDPMGFLLPNDVPMTRFLADQYAICDHWFSALPCGTQPNRLMAWTGTTLIDSNGLFPPRDELLLDWLEKREVRWRVYTSGLSFFMLLGSKFVFGPNFRDIDRLAPDVANELPGDFPQVIIVEPAYADAARIIGGVANDNHAPLAVCPGEVLLRRVYEALTVNPKRWARTVFIVYYDEHGGFFDHVPPPLVTFPPPSNATFKDKFESLGVRIPGLVVSPLVSPKRVCKDVLEHTSVLQLLAEKFTPGKPYSAAVDARRKQGVRSLSVALDRSVPRIDVPVAPDVSCKVAIPLASETKKAPTTALEQTFEDAARAMVAQQPKATAQRYPAVSHWVLSNPVNG